MKNIFVFVMDLNITVDVSVVKDINDLLLAGISDFEAVKILEKIVSNNYNTGSLKIEKIKEINFNLKIMIIYIVFDRNKERDFLHQHLFIREEKNVVEEVLINGFVVRVKN